jgi:hypothetical protein
MGPLLDTAGNGAALIFATHTTDACCCACSFPSRSRWFPRTSTDFTEISDRRRIWAATVCGDHVGAHDRTTRQCSTRDWQHCARIGHGGWGRQRHDPRQRVSVDAKGCAGWQASFCDVQGYEYPQYCYPRALARSPTACSDQSRWRIRRSQRRFFRAIISPNHSLARFILVCENSMREGQCRHENSAIPI